MADKYVLSEDDVSLLRELLAAHRGRYLSTTQRPAPTEEQGNAPEVYVAKTPVTGIPGRIGDVPGSADCDLYRLLPDQANTQTLTQVEPLTRLVYTLSEGGVLGSLYVLVKRDKWGQFYADDSAVGGACLGTFVEEVDLRCEYDGPGTGTSGTGLKHSLNLYRRVAVLEQDPSGCLTRSVGPYVKIKTVACCDPSCKTPGTGTSNYCWPCATSDPPYGESVCLILAGSDVSGCWSGKNITLPWSGAGYGGVRPDWPCSGLDIAMFCEDGVPFLFISCAGGSGGVVFPFVSITCSPLRIVFGEGKGIYSGICFGGGTSGTADAAPPPHLTAVVVEGSCSGTGTSIGCADPCVICDNSLAPSQLDVPLSGFTGSFTSMNDQIANFVQEAFPVGCTWTSQVLVGGGSGGFSKQTGGSGFIMRLVDSSGREILYESPNGPLDCCSPIVMDRLFGFGFYENGPPTLTATPCGGCCPTPCSGTGTDGSVCGITDFPLGKADNANVSATASISSVTLVAGDLLIVNAGEAGGLTPGVPSSVTWNGIALTQAGSGAFATSVGSSQWYLKIAASATGNIVATHSPSATFIAVSAVKVQGLVSGTLSASGNSNGTSPTPPTGSLTAGACSYNQASFMTTLANAGTWGGGFEPGDQDDVYTTTYRLTEGFLLSEAGGPVTPTFTPGTGSYTAWAGSFGSYV